MAKLLEATLVFGGEQQLQVMHGLVSIGSRLVEAR